MVENNKSQYNPDKVSLPGETLADILEERGMSQAELSERTGRPLKTINEIIKGKAAITPETAIQLERVLGVPALFWNQREANYRSHLASQKEEKALSPHKNWLEQFPLQEMLSRGWIQTNDHSATDHMIGILNFFGVATPEKWNEGWTRKRLAFRKATHIETDVGATAAWLRQGEIEGARIDCKPFNREALITSLRKIRELTLETEPKIFIPKLQKICSECGVTLVFIQGFSKVTAFGSSSWLNSEKALVQLSVRGKMSDQLWFTIFHELGHVLKHSKKELFIDLKEEKDVKKSPEEIEADEFAANTLIPENDLNKWLEGNPVFTANNIRDFASEIGIAPGIVVGRLQHMKKIPWATSLNSLKTSYAWKK